jgi:hypothetical protein
VHLYLQYPHVTRFGCYIKLTIATVRTKTPWNTLGIDKEPTLQFTMHKARDDLTKRTQQITATNKITLVSMCST